MQTSNLLFSLPVWSPVAVANAIESLAFFEAPPGIFHVADSGMKDFFIFAEGVHQTFPEDPKKLPLRQGTNLSTLQWALASNNRYTSLLMRRGLAQTVRGLKPSEMKKVLRTIQNGGGGSLFFRDTPFSKPIVMPVLSPPSSHRPAEEITKLCACPSSHFSVPEDDFWSHIPDRPGFSVMHVEKNKRKPLHAILRDAVDKLPLPWLVEQTRRLDKTQFLSPKPILPQSIESALSDLTRDANLLPHFRFLLRVGMVRVPDQRLVEENFWPVVWAPPAPRLEAELQVYMQGNRKDPATPLFLPYKAFVKKIVEGSKVVKDRMFVFIPMEIPKG